MGAIANTDRVCSSLVFNLRALILASVVAAFAIPVAAQQEISVGGVIVDAPTIVSLGFSVPIVSGDDNYNATAVVSYRRLGNTNWLPALDMMRVRPETIGTEDPPENFGLPRPGNQFAGSVMSLDANTSYEVRIEVSDPDGGSRSQTITAKTRAVPRTDPVSPRLVNVASASQFQNALQNAVPGDVITLANGTYAGRFNVQDLKGTAENPIVIRGQDKNNTIIDGTGMSFAVYVYGSDYVHIENIKITGVRGSSRYGLYLGNGEGLTARNLVFDTDNGIHAYSESGGPNRGYYICDNELAGATSWPTDLAVGSNTAQKSWIGIGIAGHGHTVCHNTLSGFGSTIFVGFDTIAHSIAIDIHNNDIQWSMDDGIELDGSFRNVRVWENRIRNVLMGISFQPVWGGPIYAYRNIVYNSAAAPLKLNNDPSGIVLYHNTMLRYGETDIVGPYDSNAWPQIGLPGNYAANTWIKNNIFIGNSGALFILQNMPYMELDYNGYLPNQAFSLGDFDDPQVYDDLGEFQTGTGFETNGVTMNGPVFAVTPPVSTDYKILGPALDFALHGNADTIDSGVALPTINDGYSGSAPDLGALEFGDTTRLYGFRSGYSAPPIVPPPTEVFPSGGETLHAATTIDVTWNTNGAPVSSYYDLAYREDCTPDVFFSDDMESGSGLWGISHGAGTLDWVLAAGNPHGGATAWFASEPDTVSDQYLSSAGLVMVPANGQLGFWHSYDTEASYDGGVVEISTDGIVWNDLGPYVTQGGYNSTISVSYGSPIGGRNAFSGNSGGYIETLVDLGSYSGQNVYIRFRMASDSSVSGNGWYVDDVSLVGAVSPWMPIGTTSAGASSLSWTVPLNTGGDYCLSIQGMAPGYTNSPQVITTPFTVSDADSDGDGLNNIHEVTVLGTNPESVDSDGDGLADGAGGVVLIADLPGGIDVNGDGFVDGEMDYGTDPVDADSDNDGVADGDEVSLYGIDPTVSNVGDVGPRGSPDNLVNLGDLVVLTRLVTGVIQPTALESVLGDINSDGQLNVADLLLLQQAILSGTAP